MTLTGKALREMKDIGRKAGIVPDVGSLFKTKKNQKTNKTQQNPRDLSRSVKGWDINCALRRGGKIRIAAD